ncbi:MAG: DNA polymerase [Phycisphaerae bacterium]
MGKYLFVDMNSFFASVEQQERPELRGRPVGILPTLVETTGCIAASYEAKALGIKTGTSVREARQRCPSIALVEARPEVYVQYHEKIIAAVEQCLHVDKVCSIDEMYGRLLGEECQPEAARTIALRVKATIYHEVGTYIRCSIGIAPNPWLAKIASDMQKPDGLTMLQLADLPGKLEPLKLTDLPGIATNMQRRLALQRVHTVLQLWQLDEAQMIRLMNSRVVGIRWWHRLHGYDLPEPTTHRRSLSQSHVLPPELRTTEGAYGVLVRLIHKAAARLRRIEYRAEQLHVYMDHRDGPQWYRRVPLGLCGDTLTMLEALGQAWREHPPWAPLKVGVVLAPLVAPGGATLPLFPQQTRRDLLAATMDQLDRQYGRHCVYFAGMHNARQAAPTRISFTQIPTDDEF